MKVPALRGALSGMLLVLLGAWVAIIPFVGPLFNYSIGSTAAWNWQAGWFWLNVLPGAVALLVGLAMMSTRRRIGVGTAGFVAVIAGGWIIVAPQVSRVWNHGVSASGAALGSADLQVLEILGYSLLPGALIAVIGAFAFGTSSAISMEVVPRDEVVAREPAPVPTSGRGRLRGRHARSGRRAQPDRSDEIDVRTPPPEPATQPDASESNDSGGRVL